MRMKEKRVVIQQTSGKRVARSVRHHRSVAKQNRTVMRLMLCGIIVAGVVATKLLFPQEIDALAKRVSKIIGRDADFFEAFAAVGRAVGGEETVGDSLQDAFLAVFGSLEVPAENNPDEDPGIPQPTLSSQTVGTPEDLSEKTETETMPSPDPSGIYVMQSLPENASLDQRNLGFPCVSPVIGTLSSPFGWRDHPTEGGTRFHYGIDLAAEKGSDIAAFADGEVFAVGESSTLGKYIILTHAGGYRTLYAHCSEVIIKSGSVKMGEIIARVGDSGSATGAHLHFELQDGALYLNPIYYVAIR